MREIKFRGLHRGVMIYGGVIKVIFGKFYYQIEDSAYKCTTYTIEDPETIGQYTGLKDANGVEIYEGDIIKLSEWDGVATYGVIVFSTENDFGVPCFLIKSQYGFEPFFSPNDCPKEWFKVCGNIHENPELVN